MRATIGTITLSGAAMGFLTACGQDTAEEEQTAYCVDENDNVVDDDLCDESERNGGFVGGVPYFFFLGSFGGNRYSPGQRIPSTYTSSGTRINPSDSSARSRAGLPSSGRVSSGTRVTGGIGSGANSGSRNGSSGS